MLLRTSLLCFVRLKNFVFLTSFDNKSRNRQGKMFLVKVTLTKYDVYGRSLEQPSKTAAGNSRIIGNGGDTGKKGKFWSMESSDGHSKFLSD
jgi:hypothetical protein